MANDELLDVLDEQGKPTGRTATRAEVHTQGLWHRSVHVWIVNSQGEILIQKRSMNKDDHPGEWDTQSGGHLLAGQTPLEGAVRELKEELGIDIQPTELELLFERHQQSHRPGYINNEYNPVLLYTTDRSLSDFTFTDGEVDELRWVTIPELERLIAKRGVVVHGAEEPRVVTMLKERWNSQ